MAGFGGAVKLTGESEYKKALASINQSLKEVDSELKLVTSAYDKNDKSEKALSAQTDALTKKYEAQSQKVNTIRDAYSKLSGQVEESERKHKELGKELDAETDLLKEIEKASGKDSEAYKEQADKVLKLTQEYDKESAEIEKNKKAVSDMYIEMNKAQTAMNKTGKELETLSKEGEDASQSEKKVAEGAKEAGKETDNASKGGISAFSVALGNLVSGAISSAIQGMKDLANAAKEAFASFDDGRDAIIYATGATGEAAESLQQSYENVSKNVVADMGDIGKVIGEVNTRFGFTEGQLEDASTSFLKFAKVTGMDAKTAVQSVSRAMEKAGIDGSKLDDTLDMLLTASQKSGVAVDRLTDSLTKYSVPMKELGFSTEDTIAIFAQFEKTGVNVEQAFNGMQKAAGNWAKEGKDASVEFTALMEEIKNAPDDLTATQKATEIFGAKTGGEFAAAVRTGKLEYSDMLGLITNSKGSLESTFDGTIDASDDLKLAWQGVKTDLAKIVDKILKEYGPGIKKAIEAIKPALSNLADKVLPAIKATTQWIGDNILPVINNILGWINDNLKTLLPILVAIGGAILVYETWSILTKAVTAAQTLLNAVLAANPIMLVVMAVGALVAALVYLFNTDEIFREQVLETWDKIKEGAKICWEWLKNLVTKTIPEALYNLGEKIVTTGANVLEFIGRIPEKIGGFLGDIIYNVTSWVSDMKSKATEAAKGFLDNVIEKIKAVPGDIKSKLDDAISNVTSWAGNLATEATNAGKDFLEKIWEEIKGLPDKFLNLGKDCIKGFKKGFDKLLFGGDGLMTDEMREMLKQGKQALDVNSPSKRFANELGAPSAEGFGVGFKKAMRKVTAEMFDTIPNEVDVSANVKTTRTGAAGAYGGLSAQELAGAVKEALLGVDVVMDDRKMGQFVTKTVTAEIYS